MILANVEDTCPIYLLISRSKEEVIINGRSKICELMNYLQCVIVAGEGGGLLDILVHYLGFLQAELLAGL